MGKQQEKLENVMMKNLSTGEHTQLTTGLTFGQAYSMVVDLRAKRDGNRYWIGTLKNHVSEPDHVSK